MAYKTFHHNLVAEDAPYQHFQAWPDWLEKTNHAIEDVLEDSTTRKAVSDP